MSGLMQIHEIRLKNARDLMKKSGLSRTDFAEKVGLSYNLLSQYIGKNPTKKIGDETANKIEEAFDKPKGFLDQVDAVALPLGEVSLAKNDNFHQVSVWDEKTPLEDDEVEIPFFEDFSFACGGGSIGEALDSNKQKLRLPKAVLRKLDIDKKNAVATLAAGDSMTPEIKDGNTIHIDLGRKIIKDGKIYAICHGGLFMAKRLYNLPQGGVRIVSDNAIEYPEVVLTAEERKQQEFEVIGWIWQITSIQSW